MTCIRHEKETEYQKVMSRGRMGWAGVGWGGGAGGPGQATLKGS